MAKSHLGQLRELTSGLCTDVDGMPRKYQLQLPPTQLAEPETVPLYGLHPF